MIRSILRCLEPLDCTHYTVCSFPDGVHRILVVNHLEQEDISGAQASILVSLSSAQKCTTLVK